MLCKTHESTNLACTDSAHTMLHARQNGHPGYSSMQFAETWQRLHRSCIDGHVRSSETFTAGCRPRNSSTVSSGICISNGTSVLSITTSCRYMYTTTNYWTVNLLKAQCVVIYLIHYMLSCRECWQVIMITTHLMLNGKIWRKDVCRNSNSFQAKYMHYHCTTQMWLWTHRCHMRSCLVRHKN